MRTNALRPRSLPRVLGLLVFCLTAGLSVTACSFNPCCPASPDELLPFRDETPFSEPTSREQSLVYEEPGVFAAFHGTTCAESNLSGREVPLRIQEELFLPKELDQGTVLFNGFHLSYLQEDHHVSGLGTAIGTIEINNGVLRWEAGGVLSDDDFNDGYGWCYTYTAVAWNSQQLQASVSHGDTGHAFSNLPWTDGTALQPLPGYLENPSWMGLEEVAVVPRGFGYIWIGEDHHVLQLAYELDAGEVYVEKNKKYGNGTVPVPSSQVGTGYVTWESTGFIKDNETQRQQYLFDLVTGLGGSDVDLIAPPFSVAPREDAGIGCVSTGSGGHTAERMVLTVPFEFAIPVLTGWDLAYLCDDEHVDDVGAWISKWKWEPGALTAGGTLTYTVETRLSDQDDSPDFFDRTQVKILGFRRITPVAGR
jgi:hypothetical protein